MSDHLPADEKTQLTHARDSDGNCGFCLRHHRLRIRAGSCAPFQLAAWSIRARRQGQALRRLRVAFLRPRT